MRKAGAHVDAVDEDGNSMLHLLAVQENAGRTVASWLDKGANVNAANADSDTPLHLAVREIEGCLYTVELLLRRGADVKAVNKRGWTPLHCAAQEPRGPTELVTLLLERGADVEATDSYGNSPLHLAAKVGALSKVELLLKNGADFEAVNRRGWTALHCAAQEPRGPTELVTLLLERGADVEATDSDGNSPLHLAAKVGALSKVELLLKNGADFEAVNKDYVTALHFASKFARHEIAELLLTGGANKNAISVNDNSSSQLLAHDFTDQRSAEKLLKKGAKVDVRDKDGRTPLHLLAHYGDVEITSLVNLLLQNGAAVNAVDNNGSTPLHFAAQHVRSNIVEVLLDNGAYINAADRMGNTALHFACGAYNAADMVKMLLARGAMVDAVNNYGSTPMLRAVRRKSGVHSFVDQNVRMLLDNGANNFDAVDEGGNTMLHYAIQHVRYMCACNSDRGLGKEFFKILLDRKVRVNIFNNDGDSPLHLADDDSVIKELLNLGADINLQHDCYKSSALHRAVTNKREAKVILLLNNGIDSNLKCRLGETALQRAISQRSEPWSQDSNELVCKCLTRHVIRLKVAGLYVCPEDLSLVEREYDDTARRFEESCRGEVERLKRARFGRYTLLNILTDHHNPKYARNEPLVEQLLSQSFKGMPIYGCHIVRLLKKSRSRLELVTLGWNSLKLLLRAGNLFSETKMPTLPIEILEEVVSYLDDKDLQNLYRCCAELVRK